MYPVYGNPRAGLLRTFLEPDRVLRSPLRDSCVQGVLNCLVTGRALVRVTTQRHRPNRQKFQTIFGQFLENFDIFRTFCRHSLFLGCPTICPLQQLPMQEERFCAPCTRKPPNGPSKNLLKTMQGS